MRRLLARAGLAALSIAVVTQLVIVYFDAVFVVGGKWLSHWMLASQWEPPADRLDYTDREMWAARPDVADYADSIPLQSGLEDKQRSAKVDVFFVHPTTYFGSSWIGPVKERFNPMSWSSDVVVWTVAGVHAGAFNGAGRVFAPRYRQMTGMGFLSEDTRSVQRAMDFAYRDVLDAFNQFLVETGSERPFILAGHSQGSMHLQRLLVEEVASSPRLYDRFVAGYLLGSPMTPKDISPIPVCNHAEQTGCVVGWNIFWKGGDVSKFILVPENASASLVVCVNPLSWRVDEEAVDAAANPGSCPLLPIHAVLGDGTWAEGIGRLEPGRFSAQCSKGVLWTDVPTSNGFHVTGVFPGYNAHGGETTYFYLSIRRNAELRAKKKLALIESNKSHKQKT